MAHADIPQSEIPANNLSAAPEIRKVLIIGAGTMGPEVAAQCAAYGFNVTLYDIDAGQLTTARATLEQMLSEQAARGMITTAAGSAALARVTMTTDPDLAAAEADLVTESVTESLKIKREVLGQFARLCPAHTILTTNTSYFVPSMMSKSLPRPENFAAYHFHNPVWFANVVDIMPHAGTSPETIERLRQFSVQIGQTPIVERQENHGYVFNAMLREFLSTAVDLAARGVADVADIDRAWMGVTKMPIGPFGMIDTIGLDTVHDIVSFWGAAMKDPQARINAEWLERVIDEGRHGMRTGRGFYDYPQPAYAQPDFLMAPGSNAGVTIANKPAPSPPQLTPAPAASAAPAAEAAPPSPSPATTSPAGFARWSICMQPTEAQPLRSQALLGPVLIVGQGPAADALEHSLRAQSAVVLRVPQLESVEAAVNFSAELLAQHDIPHLILLTGLAANAATSWYADTVQARNTAGLLVPYFVCREWFKQRLERGVLDRSTLLAGVALGGSLGLTPPVVSAEGGGMAGLLKAVHMEGIASGIIVGTGVAGVFGPQTRLMDFQGNESPANIAKLVLEELGELVMECNTPITAPEEAFRRHSNIEVGHRRGKRHHLRMRLTPLPASTPNKTTSIQSGDTWIITGGARGITAKVARALGEQYGLRLVLLGTTPLPDEDFLALSEADLAERKSTVMKQAFASGQKPNVAWERVARGVEIQRSLAELQAAGITANYFACDIADRQQLAEILNRVRNELGPIRGVLHGAGVEVTGRFDKKPVAEVQRTLAPKFMGTLALMELTANDALTWFIGFGSLSGRFGGVGQTDYAMANDALAKLMDWYRLRRPECKSFCVHWPGWAEIGMAARPASKFSLEKSGHTLLQPAEGVALLLKEIAAGAPDSEVVFMAADEMPQAARDESSR